MRFTKKYPLLLLLLGWLGVAPGPARAAAPPTIERMRIGFQNTYQIGSWIPVRVDARGGATRFEGTLDIEAPDEDGAPVLSRTPVAIEPNTPVSIVAYVRPGTNQGDAIVARLRDASGNSVTLPARAINRDGSQPTDIAANQTLILTLGNPWGVKEVPTLSAFQGLEGRQFPLVVIAARPEELPGRWYGLDAASVIVLDTNDTAVLEALRTKRDVLQRWVENGGHLVVAVASRGQEVVELLGPLLPAVPSGTVRLNDLGEIEAFAGPKTAPIPAPAMGVARLEQLDARNGRAVATTTTTPIVVRGPVGFGLVTVVGIDTDRKPFSNWKDRALFWARALDLRPPEHPEVLPGGYSTPAMMYQSDLATVFQQALDRPPGVKPIPFAWVAFAVLGYILLIGPLDYLFLKRIAKRMELTWVTFPAIVVLTSAAAYGLAYAWKGSDLKVMKADAIDVDQVNHRARGFTWFTLFSPRNHDYDVTIAPRSAGKEGAEPEANVERLVSWFAPVDPRLGGGGTARMSLSNASYRTAPDGRSDSLVGVRVPIWSTKSFSGRWSQPLAAPLLEADLTPSGADRIEGSVTNVSNLTLNNAVLIYENQVYDQLGKILPGGTIHVDFSSRVRPLSGYLEELAGRRRYLWSYTGKGWAEGSGDPLADLVRLAMFREGMGAKTMTPPSFPMHDLDLTSQLAFDRPIVMATIDWTAADIQLDRAAPVPKTEQTTVVRVILPQPKSKSKQAAARVNTNIVPADASRTVGLAHSTTGPPSPLP